MAIRTEAKLTRRILWPLYLLLVLLLLPSAWIVASLFGDPFGICVTHRHSMVVMRRCYGLTYPGVGVIELPPSGGRGWLLHAGNSWQYLIYFGPPQTGILMPTQAIPITKVSIPSVTAPPNN